MKKAVEQILAMRAAQPSPAAMPGQSQPTGYSGMGYMPSPHNSGSQLFPQAQSSYSHHGYDAAGNMDAGQGDRRSPPNTSIWRLRFTGADMDLENYLSQLDCVAASRGWNDHEKGTLLLSNLEKDATRVMSQIPRGCVSYEIISNKLREMFAPRANIIAYKAQFQCRTRRPFESANEFGLALRDLGGKAFPEKSQAELELMMIDQYIRGQPNNIRCFLTSVQYTSLAEAIATVTRHEAYTQPLPDPEPQGIQGRRGNTKAARGQAAYTPPASAGYYSEVSETSEYQPVVQVESHDSQYSDFEQDPLADLIGELAGLEFVGTSASSAQDKPCYYCGKGGHFWSTCRALLEKLRERGFKGTDLLARPGVPARSGGPYNNRGGPRGPSNSYGNPRPRLN